MKEANGRRHPAVYVIAGPNGSGKTTFAMRFLPDIAGCRVFINADLIAGGLSPLNVDAAAVEAGRVFLRQIQEHVHARRDFAFETTLAGLSYLRLLRDMHRAGYIVRIYYLWIPDVGLALKRIAERVRRGGHDIPEPVVRRRYGRGLANLFRRYIPLADYCAIFDNSSTTPLLVYERSEHAERVMRRGIFGRIQRQAEGI